ncbi:hypothetical protein ACGFI4_17175 [Micromonospora carbonacea]|uniref:hypothetical protein n=1 Tax=Micromonospora carbonacea TaxID=47853 RepID=UPI003715BC57
MITSRADRVDAAMDRLRRAGRRTTLARRAVLDALSDAAAERRHLNASEVHQRLTGRGLAVELSTCTACWGSWSTSVSRMPCRWVGRRRSG